MLMLNNYDNMLPCLTNTNKYSSQFAGDDYEFIIIILNVLIITQKKRKKRISSFVACVGMVFGCVFQK